MGNPRNHGTHGRELIGLDKLLCGYLIVALKLLIGGFQGLSPEQLIVELLVGRKKLLAFCITLIHRVGEFFGDKDGLQKYKHHEGELTVKSRLNDIHCVQEVIHSSCRRDERSNQQSLKLESKWLVGPNKLTRNHKR